MRHPLLLHNLLPRLRVLRPCRPLAQRKAELHLRRRAIPQWCLGSPRNNGVFALIRLRKANIAIADSVPAGEFGPEAIDGEGAPV